MLFTKLAHRKMLWEMLAPETLRYSPSPITPFHDGVSPLELVV